MSIHYNNKYGEVICTQSSKFRTVQCFIKTINLFQWYMGYFYSRPCKKTPARLATR